MAVFYMAMARSDKARKLYAQIWLICLLLFHYVYACGHIGEFGILLSTGVCAAMFSFKRTDNWFRKLLDCPRAFVILALVTVVIGFVPHLYTLSVTVTFLLLAALFYPSGRVMSECKDAEKRTEWVKYSQTLSESYYDNHHAGLPHNADNGNSVHPQNNNHQKQDDNEK